MRSEAKKNKVCTQMGNQGTAANGLRRAVELVHAGELGDGHRGPRLDEPPDVLEAGPGRDRQEPAEADRVPNGRPLGRVPRRRRPTRPVRRPACHPLRLARVLGLRHRRHRRHGLPHREHGVHGTEARAPDEVSAEAGDVNPVPCPSWAHVTHPVPGPRRDAARSRSTGTRGRRTARSCLPPEDLVDEGDRPSQDEAAGRQRLDPRRREGHRVLAERLRRERVLQHRQDGQRLRPSPRRCRPTTAATTGQKKEWVEAIKAGKPELALSNFDYAGLLTAAFLLGQRGDPHRQDVRRSTARSAPRPTARRPRRSSAASTARAGT